MARTVIGLDVGHQQVRAIALAPVAAARRREGRRARVLGSAVVARRDGDGEAKPLAAVMAEIDALLGLRGPVHVHLGDAQTLVRFIPTIPLPEDRRQRLLRLELLQHADERGDLAADAFEVPLTGEEIIHGCVVGQPAQITAGLTALAQARLPIAAVAYGPAALANAVPAGAVGDGMALVVDIGANGTSVTLVGEGLLYACRRLAIGGDDFTTAFAAATGLDPATAEARKRGEAAPAMMTPEPPAPSVPVPPPAAADDGIEMTFSLDDGVTTATTTKATTSELQLEDELFLDGQTPSTAPTVPGPLPSLELDDGPGLTLELETTPAPLGTQMQAAAITLPPVAIHTAPGLNPAFLRAAETLYAQLSSSLLWFRTQLKLERLDIQRVLLAGGGGALAGLDSYLAGRFAVPVTVMDPFSDLDGDHPATAPAAWATAIGLALADRSLSAHPAVRLDVRPSSLVVATFRRRHLVWPYVAAACVVATTAIIGVERYQSHGADETNLAAHEAWKKDREGKLKQLADIDTRQAALGEDLRAIAGRIYAGRDLLYAVRALKERTADSKELWVTRFETRGLTSDPAKDAAPLPLPGKGISDTAIDRGSLVISGKVKFDAAPTDVERDQFLQAWRKAIVGWKPSPEAPTLFIDQKIVRWDPIHTTGSGKKPGDSGEFPFTVRFTFRPTDLTQVTVDSGAGR